jgi:hypothetical protein
MRRLATATLSAVLLGLSSAAALAFSDEPVPSGPGASQFADPDEAMENIANGAGGGSGTEISTGNQLPSGTAVVHLAPVTPGDAEPVNPSWPAWMVWHQQ